MRLVTVATFPYVPEAQLAQSALAARGIDSILADEHIIGLDPLATTVFDGVKVQVADAFADDARSVLAALPDDGEAGDEAGDEAAEEDEESRNPRSRAITGASVLLALLLLGYFAGMPHERAAWFLAPVAIGGGMLVGVARRQLRG